jgi:hypothetical protein
MSCYPEINISLLLKDTYIIASLSSTHGGVSQLDWLALLISSYNSIDKGYPNKELFTV